MTYKEFLAWCNDRTRDGCWGFNEALLCSQIARRIYSRPFWKRKKEWSKIKEEVEIEKIVFDTNAKIRAYKTEKLTLHKITPEGYYPAYKCKACGNVTVVEDECLAPKECPNCGKGNAN